MITINIATLNLNFGTGAPAPDTVLELAGLEEGVQQMSDALDAAMAALTAEVANNDSVKDSATQMIHGLAAQIQARIGDAAALQSLVDHLKANDGAIAQAVVDGTGASLAPTPTPAPAPAPAPAATSAPADTTAPAADATPAATPAATDTSATPPSDTPVA